MNINSNRETITIWISLELIYKNQVHKILIHLYRYVYNIIYKHIYAYICINIQIYMCIYIHNISTWYLIIFC